MVSQIDIIKEGGRAKITVNDTGVVSSYIPILEDVSLSYDAIRNVVNVSFIANLYNFYFPGMPAANVTIGGVVPNSQSIFDAQVAAVFTSSDPTTARSNIDMAPLVTLSAATASGNGADLTNANGRGIQLVVDITAITTGSLTVTIQGKDAASGKYYNLLMSASFSSVGTNQLTIYPGIAVAANVSSSQPLPKVWRVIYAITGTVTATIGASVIV